MDYDNFYISVCHAGVERTWTLEDDIQTEVWLNLSELCYLGKFSNNRDTVSIYMKWEWSHPLCRVVVSSEITYEVSSGEVGTKAVLQKRVEQMNSQTFPTRTLAKPSVRSDEGSPCSGLILDHFSCGHCSLIQALLLHLTLVPLSLVISQNLLL